MTNPQDDWDEDSTKFEAMTYAGQCRCGHRIVLDLPAKPNKDNRMGKWVECAECAHISYCPREQDEDVVERTYVSELVVNPEDPKVITFS